MQKAFLCPTTGHSIENISFHEIHAERLQAHYLDSLKMALPEPRMCVSYVLISNNDDTHKSIARSSSPLAA